MYHVVDVGRFALEIARLTPADGGTVRAGECHAGLPCRRVPPDLRFGHTRCRLEGVWLG